MPNTDDTIALSPAERLRQMASILAQGVLRLAQRRALPHSKEGREGDKKLFPRP